MSEKAANCETLKLSGPLGSIKASYDDGRNSRVNAISYQRLGKSKGYGPMTELNTVWRFGIDFQLVGMHGYSDGETIK